MSELVRVQVLMPRPEADRFDIYCIAGKRATKSHR